MEKNQSVKNILIAGPKAICDAVKDILSFKKSYQLIIAQDGVEAEKNIYENDIHLLITSMNLQNINGFALINKMKSKDHRIPYILLTALDITEIIGLAFEYNVGYVISKSYKKKDFLDIISKLLNQVKFFQLENYFRNDPLEIQNLMVHNFSDILTASSKISDYLIQNKLDDRWIQSVQLIFDEMLVNAYYHGHGFTFEKTIGIPVDLPEGMSVKIQYTIDLDKFGFTISDFNGKLTTARILKSLNECISNHENMTKALEEGLDPSPYLSDSGRGFQIALEGADEFYVNIIPDKLSQVVVLFNLDESDTIQTHSKALRLLEFKNNLEQMIK